MTELDTHQPNPLERLNIAEYGAPTYDQLTPEQQQKLEAAGIPWVETPVDVDAFENTEHFKRDSNNFYMRFNSGFIGTIYRNQHYYKRFDIVHPDISQYLQQTIDAKNITDLTDDDWKNLEKAYAIMSAYVDANDPTVTKDGRIDTYHLRG